MPLLFGLVTTQGLSQGMQVLVAGFLSPVEFGLIRLMESTVGMAVLITASGPTAIAIATAHEDPSVSKYWTLLGATMVTAVPVSLVGGLYLATLDPRIPLFALVVPLSGAVRVTVGFLQGSSRVRLASKTTVKAATFGSAVIAAACFLWGVPGWLLGRLISEANAARALVVSVSNLTAIRFINRHNIVRTAFEGYQVTAALVLRYAMDNIALLSLGIFQPNSENLGLFGFATTLYSIVLLVPAALVTLGTPRLSRLIGQSAPGNSLLRLQLLTVAVALPAGFLVSFLYWRFAPFLYPRFAGASSVVFILCAAAPFRALASTSGAFLLVRGRRRIQIWLNLGLAGIAIPTLIVAVMVSSQLWVVAMLMLAGEIVSAASYLAAAWQTQREESLDFQGDIMAAATIE